MVTLKRLQTIMPLKGADGDTLGRLRAACTPRLGGSQLIQQGDEGGVLWYNSKAVAVRFDKSPNSHVVCYLHEVQEIP